MDPNEENHCSTLNFENIKEIINSTTQELMPKSEEPKVSSKETFFEICK